MIFHGNILSIMQHDFDQNYAHTEVFIRVRKTIGRHSLIQIKIFYHFKSFISILSARIISIFIWAFFAGGTCNVAIREISASAN